MSFLSQLKHIIKINADFRHFINININNNNVSETCEINEEKRTLSINLEKLDYSEKEQIGKAITEAVRKEDRLLLEQNSEKIIEDFKLNENSKHTKSILSHFKEVIPPDDYEALRAALYIKKCFDEDLGGIYKLKGDIIKKYGKRGLNISNLCSAGYFETWILPIHNEMKKDPNFSNEKFFGIYNIIINESAFAVFVSGSMSNDNVKITIEEKIKRNLRYGIKFVNIHGIGKDNVKKIRGVISEIEVKYPKITKSIEKEKNIIFVKLRFDQQTF